MELEEIKKILDAKDSIYISHGKHDEIILEKVEVSPLKLFCDSHDKSI